MTSSRLSARLILAGATLVALGLLCWAGGVDRALHPWLRVAPGGTAAQAAALLSAAGRVAPVAALVLGIAVALLLAHRGAAALWLIVTVAGGRLATEALKFLVRRPRPPLADRLEHVGDWSFPSAHSSGAAVALLAVALVIGRGRLPFAAALLLAAAIGWSRLALGVHWPGDVLAGWGVGLAWTGAALRVPAWRRCDERG